MRRTKTRVGARNVKALDRAATAAERMKNAFVRTRDGTQQTQVPEHDSPGDYAIEKVQNRAGDVVRETGHKANEIGKKAFHKTRDMRRTRKSRAGGQGAGGRQHTGKAANQPGKLMKTRARDAAKRSRAAARHSAGKTVKRSARSAFKATKKTIKTAENTGKTAVKVAKQTANLAKKTARAARAAARAAATAAKAAANAVFNFLKAAIAAIRTLVTVIIAGGWVAVIVILVICMAALLVCSVFGIFFSSEEGVSENGMTMKTVSTLINTEFNQELVRIQRENPHDRCEITANRALWKEVFAVYAVKTNTDTDNPLDVITLDDRKADLLRTVFWDMHVIEYDMEEVVHTDIFTNEDGEIETEVWYEYILHLTVTGKTADQMAEQYGFTAKQGKLLAELLRPEYDSLWAALLPDVEFDFVEGTEAVGLGSYIWPSGNSDVVTSFFGTRVHPITGEIHQHYGIDISAAEGTAVLAADGGTVTVAGWHGSYGNYVVIDHGNGNQTLYAHMSSLSVGAGQAVAQGQTIGLVGSTGSSTGPHLHFETHVNVSRVDPLIYYDNYRAAW